MNDDFTDKKTDLGHLEGGVVMVQEAKNVNVRKVVDRDEFRTQQNLSDDAHAGSAMFWRRDRFKVLGQGQVRAAKADGNDDMLDRYITFSDLKVRGSDVKVRMASAHRPPGDERDEWPEFDAALRRFAKKAEADGLPVVIGMDANFPKGAGRAAAIRRLEEKTGLVWHGVGIDGFLTSKDVKFNTKPKKGDDDFSDHDPVSASITVRERK